MFAPPRNYLQSAPNPKGNGTMAFEHPQHSVTTAKATTHDKVQELEGYALEMRKSILKLCSKAGMLHLGGDLSIADIMIGLWKYKLMYDPKRPKWEGRDRFILSKGHAAGALYVAQALAGCYELQTVYDNYLQPGKDFGVHPGNCTPTIEIGTGSLGHGLSIAVGMAKALRLKNCPSRVFCVMGDGETQEGSVWEAAMAASHLKLGNLVAIVDRNGFSLDGPTEEIMGLEPYADKWKAFGWNVIEINGNDMSQIVGALDSVPETSTQQPTMIIAKTTKGFGISFMENKPEWHAGSVNAEMLPKCLAELEERFGKRGTL
jgi:transketolase